MHLTLVRDSGYELVPTAAIPAPCCGGHRVRETRRIEIISMPPASPEAVAAAQDALARRRAVAEARLLGKVGR
jgi:hypothetical protein